jgi:hypothetical protein
MARSVRSRGDLFRGSSKLDVQGSAARAIDQESIWNLAAASMTASEGSDHVCGYCLCVCQAAAGNFMQGSQELDAAAARKVGEPLLVTFRRQHETKAPFTLKAGWLSLVDELDRISRAPVQGSDSLRL